MLHLANRPCRTRSPFEPAGQLGTWGAAIGSVVVAVLPAVIGAIGSERAGAQASRDAKHAQQRQIDAARAEIARQEALYAQQVQVQTQGQEAAPPTWGAPIAGWGVWPWVGLGVAALAAFGISRRR